MIKGHGGNIYALSQQLGCAPGDIHDMSSNVNPLGPPSGLIPFLLENIDVVNSLPEVDAARAIHAFSRRYDVDPELVLAGNGTTQFIYAIPQVLETRSALIVGPTYADYADACTMHGVAPAFLISEDAKNFQPDLNRLDALADQYDTTFICNPNNPTGVLIPKADLESLCRSHPKTRFIVDESYLPFVIGGQTHSVVDLRLSNVMVLNSMSKIFRIPGLRIGFFIASAPAVKKFLRYALPWSANSLAQAAVIYLMEKRDEIDAFIEETQTFLEAEKNRFMEKFNAVSCIRVFPSTTSFVLSKLSAGFTAETVCGHLSRSRILIRNCSNFEGLDHRFIRVAFKTREINLMLEDKMLELFNQ